MSLVGKPAPDFELEGFFKEFGDVHKIIKIPIETGVIHKKVAPALIADELMSEWVNASMSYCVIV